MKHTPGPWIPRLAANASGDVGIVAQSENDYFVLAETFADIRYKGEDAHQESIANARLISAAPDLLEALQAIINLDDGDKPDLWHFESEFAVARAAIAKATGEST